MGIVGKAKSAFLNRILEESNYKFIEKGGKSSEPPNLIYTIFII